MPCVFSKLRSLAMALMAVAGLTLVAGSSAMAQDRYMQRGCPGCKPAAYGQPNLFHNYTVPPACGGLGAQMYISPVAIPAQVGHTYVTYQPFMPHEMLYAHDRTYHRYYDDGRGLTRTHVSWHSPPGKHVMQHVHYGLKFAR